MKCSRCAKEWIVPPGRESAVRFCPFCGNAVTKKRMIPENAVCRPEDYLLSDPIPAKHSGILLKYTGSDRIIALPEGITSIDSGVFAKQPLWEVFLPDGLKIIGFSVFQGCHLLRKVSLPDSLAVIGNGAFEGCFNLEQIDIPGSVTAILPGTFRFCTGLKHVRLREGVRRIDAEAFRMCIHLQKIEIPDTLEEIHPSAIHCSKDIQVIASDRWKKAHPDLLSRFYYIHADWDDGRP